MKHDVKIRSGSLTNDVSTLYTIENVLTTSRGSLHAHTHCTHSSRSWLYHSAARNDRRVCHCAGGAVASYAGYRPTEAIPALAETTPQHHPAIARLCPSPQPVPALTREIASPLRVARTDRRGAGRMPQRVAAVRAGDGFIAPVQRALTQTEGNGKNSSSDHQTACSAIPQSACCQQDARTPSPCPLTAALMARRGAPCCSRHPRSLPSRYNHRH